MSPEKLRDVAWALDSLTKLTKPPIKVHTGWWYGDTYVALCGYTKQRSKSKPSTAERVNCTICEVRALNLNYYFGIT